ncbi:MAG: hypothetical protein ACK5JN_06230 [Kluyvera sp.]|uniref:hypothetical protein n=1 Tax=Kluyvera sp. TaxID=1538228 RepID=UPI003A892160
MSNLMIVFFVWLLGFFVFFFGFAWRNRFRHPALRTDPDSAAGWSLVWPMVVITSITVGFLYLVFSLLEWLYSKISGTKS